MWSGVGRWLGRRCETPERSSLDLPSTSRVVEYPNRPLSLSTLLFHLLRSSPEGSLSLSSLADRTGWSPKRLSVRLKSLETRRLLNSQLCNRGRQFVTEYSLLRRVEENPPTTTNTRRLSDVALSRRRVLLEKVGMTRGGDGQLDTMRVMLLSDVRKGVEWENGWGRNVERWRMTERWTRGR